MPLAFIDFVTIQWSSDKHDKKYSRRNGSESEEAYLIKANVAQRSSSRLGWLFQNNALAEWNRNIIGSQMMVRVKRIQKT